MKGVGDWGFMFGMYLFTREMIRRWLRCEEGADTEKKIPSWWVSAAWMTITGFFILSVNMSQSAVFVRSKTSPGRGAPLVAVLTGTMGVATVALVGGVMCLPHAGVAGILEGKEGKQGKIISDELAAPVLVVAFSALGGAMVMALMVHAVCMHELILVTGWPSPALTGVMFYLVGPLGQLAAGFLVVGEAARSGGYLDDLGSGGRARPSGEDTIQPKVLAGLPIDVISLLLALLLIGAAFIWLVLALISLVHGVVRGGLEWNPTWNGVVFPLATLAMSSLWLCYEFESPFFRVLTCVLVIICFVSMLVNIGFTIRLAVASTLSINGTAG